MLYRKKNFFSIITLLLVLFSCTHTPDIAGTISETEGGMMGIVVSSEGVPQEGVAVSLFQDLITGDSLSSEKVANTLTNSRGEYFFSNLPSGNYYVEGTQATDSIDLTVRVGEVTFDSIAAITTTFDLGIDTLLLPGYIRGSISLGIDNNRGVLIYIPGTSYQAYSDSSGEFQFSQGIAEGSAYSLVYSMDGYIDGTDDNVSVTSGDTTSLPLKELDIDPTTIPNAPTGLSAQFDTASHIVTISWSKVNHPSLAGYLIYRKDSTMTAAQPEALTTMSLIPSDTVIYYDTLTDLSFNDTTVYQYQLKSQHSNSDQSSFSEPVFVSAFLPERQTIPLSVDSAVGYWQTSFSSGDDLYFLLKSDSSAWKSEASGKSGTWSHVNDEIQITWDDGWKDRIVKLSDSTIQKYAYSPAMELGETPDNSSEAIRLIADVPVAYWPMNGNAEDVMGMTSGTLMEAGTATTGRDGNSVGALSFNRQNAILVIENDLLAFTESFTIALWYNKESFDSTNRDFLAFRGSPGSGNDAYFLSLEKEAVWKFHIEDSLGNDNNLDIPIENSHFGKWVHIAAVFDSRGKTMELYFDGISAGTRATTVSPYGLSPATEQKIRIGGYFAEGFGIDGESGLFRGEIDDVMFYDKALNSSEISVLSEN